jgi:hypothetical protein
MLVGKDGHVISAHGISGPPEGYKACENAVKKMVFEPFLALDKGRTEIRVWQQLGNYCFFRRERTIRT